MWFSSSRQDKNQPKIHLTDETIAQRAYEIWQARGCPECDGVDDWRAARKQLLAEASRPLPRKPLQKLLGRFRSRAAM